MDIRVCIVEMMIVIMSVERFSGLLVVTDTWGLLTHTIGGKP